MSQDIISLQNAIDAWSRQEALLVKALDSYAHTIHDVEHSIFRLYPCKFGEPAPDFAAERTLLRRVPSSVQLDETRHRLGRTLAGTAERIEQRLASSVELGEVLELISATVERLRDGSATQDVRLRRVTGELASAVAVEDIESFRAKVVAQLGALTKLVETMRAENRQILGELEAEMAAYRRKLDEAQQLSRTGGWTGLGKCTDLHERVREFLEAGVRFSLLVLCVPRTDLVAQVAGRLHRHLLPGEYAAALDSYALLVLVPSRSSEALARARTLQALLSTDGGRIPVSISIGVAEARDGDTLEKLLLRAEALVSCQQPQL